MGRIVTHVTVSSVLAPEHRFECDALVDTGAPYLTFPDRWRARLGRPPVIRRVEAEIATQQTVEGDICGPVRIEIEGFPPIVGEVLFLDMVPKDGIYEPLMGYIPLEQAQAAVDMIGHRLIHARRVDLK